MKEKVVAVPILRLSRDTMGREGTRLSRDTMGQIFEQFIGLELLRAAHTSGRGPRIRFWRDPDGPEVDWIIDADGVYTPVEVKWTDNPSARDIRHLEVFLSEYRTAKIGYLVCQVPRNAKLSDRITAIPWQSIDEII